MSESVDLGKVKWWAAAIRRGASFWGNRDMVADGIEALVAEVERLRKENAILKAHPLSEENLRKASSSVDRYYEESGH